MYDLVNVHQNAMAVHLTQSDCVGFKKCRLANVMDETDDMLWNGSEEDGYVRSECEEDEDMTVKVDTLTLIGKGR